MAKTVTKKSKTPLEVKTPYPKKEEKSDTDYWGEKMVKLQDRVNEIELSLSDMNLKLKKVANRMGL